jgi:hypothetical protein
MLIAPELGVVRAHRREPCEQLVGAIALAVVDGNREQLLETATLQRFVGRRGEGTFVEVGVALELG